MAAKFVDIFRNLHEDDGFNREVGVEVVEERAEEQRGSGTIQQEAASEDESFIVLDGSFSDIKPFVVTEQSTPAPEKSGCGGSAVPQPSSCAQPPSQPKNAPAASPVASTSAGPTSVPQRFIPMAASTPRAGGRLEELDAVFEHLREGINQEHLALRRDGCSWFKSLRREMIQRQQHFTSRLRWRRAEISRKIAILRRYKNQVDRMVEDLTLDLSNVEDRMEELGGFFEDLPKTLDMFRVENDAPLGGEEDGEETD